MDWFANCSTTAQRLWPHLTYMQACFGYKERGVRRRLVAVTFDRPEQPDKPDYREKLKRGAARTRHAQQPRDQRRRTRKLRPENN